MTPLSTTFLFLVFGKEKFFLEAKLAIASLLNKAVGDNTSFRIVIYTDQPDRFKHHKIESVAINNEIINKWSGDINYIYRSKIMCIKDCCNRYPDSYLIFLDTDIYFKKSPFILSKRISTSQSIMYFNEGKPGKNLLNSLKKPIIKEFISQQPRWPSGSIWNSGVIGIHPCQKKMIEKVIAFNDLYYKATSYFATEQYAFSIVFESNMGITSASDILFHYWDTVYKENFYRKAEKTQLESQSLEMLMLDYEKFIPTWPFQKKVGLRLRAYAYFFLRIKRFKVYYSMLP